MKFAKKARPKTPDAEKNVRLFRESTAQELSTVLATIVGELDYALSSSNPEAREKSTQIAAHAAERALSLSRNLGYFSGPQNGGAGKSPSDLAQILLDSVEIVERELEQAGVKINVLAEASTFVLADPQALQQVILTILNRAVKSVPYGGKITLSLRREEKTVEVRCLDDGPGLSDAQLETIFETDNHAAASEQGLSLARALIEAQGGELAVRSRQGAGTAVMFHLPFNANLPRPEPYSEERRFRRVPLILPVELFFTRGHDVLKSTLTSLSVGGCYTVITQSNHHLPELNESVSVRVRYYQNEWVEIPRGRIASVSWAGDRSGVGIEFLELDPRAKKILSALVKGHAR